MTAGAGIVVIGTGIAGLTAAQTLRAEGYDGTVTMLGAESHQPYRRTALSKDLLTADLSEARIALAKPDALADKGIDVRTGTTATQLDPAAKTVTLDDGSTLEYEALILATGGQPIRPAWLDADVPTLRTVADAERIRTAIVDSGSLVVIGGGLIGLELAASAAAAGHSVTVLDVADRVMGHVLPPVVSDAMAELHRARGVEFVLGNGVVSADASSVQTADGTVYRGTVVAALGAAPDVALAQSGGLEADGRGIVVDQTLRAADGIYAAGDVAAVPDPRTGEPARCEHWFTAQAQGAAAAQSALADLRGEPAPVFVDVPRSWTMQYGVNVQLVGWPTTGAAEVDGNLDGDQLSATITVHGDDGLVGAVTVGRAAAARDLRAQLAEALGART